MDGMSTARKDSARERILEAALKLFYERGVNAVGIDAVIEQAGVAKMSLYKHFKSKDELIAAFLRERDQRWRASFVEAVEALASDPRGRLLAAFDALAAKIEAEDYRGCAFINAVGELADPDHPGRRVCDEHVAWLRSYFLGLLRDAGARDPEAKAGMFVALIQGALSVCATERSTRAAFEARGAAEAILRAG